MTTKERVTTLIDIKQTIGDLYHKMGRIEDDLCGYETTYDGHEALVVMADGNKMEVRLAVTPVDAKEYSITLTLEEFAATL